MKTISIELSVHLLLVCMLIVRSTALKQGQCEVCVSMVSQLKEALPIEDATNMAKIEKKFEEICVDTKKQENRFCYYVGGLEESATKIVNELSKPLSWGLPADKVCERLSKKDSQICQLRYDRTIDWKTVDLKKLRVKDLRKILSDWDETCENCLEKPEFISRVEELKPKYVREEL